nr:unnamed protein product [Callosobruchus analis]
MTNFFSVFVFIQFSVLVSCELEVVQDDELMNLIRSEKYVVALFSRKYCEPCEVYENQLTSVREDLVETLNAWVIKLEESHMIRLYSPDKEPVLVFFRHGIPLLYNGPLNEELLLHTLIENKEPITKELTDETFEHLTQAATGATTGDWYVLFYTQECVECVRLQARWEAVGAQLKSRLNVARVNSATAGAATARRFSVFNVPEFILFKHGKMYRYNLHKYDVNSLVDFAVNLYKNVNSENVPLPKDMFTDFTILVANYLKENQWLIYLGAVTFLIGLLGSVSLRFLKKPVQARSSKKDNRKKK